MKQSNYHTGSRGASLVSRLYEAQAGNAVAVLCDIFHEYQEFEIDRPRYHLNMFGVRHSHPGQGLARQLLEAVHAMSRNDPVSQGVTLTTEDVRNVSLYEHFGYETIGHVRIDAQAETWGFFRPNDGSAPDNVAGGITRKWTIVNKPKLMRMKRLADISVD